MEELFLKIEINSE